MGTEFLGTICPWGLNWLGTVCPEGPISWGPIVGDQMSGDHMRLGPNVSQPGKKPLKCDICNVEYTSKPNLKKTLYILSA